MGSPIANRNRSEVENLIGFLANTLVLYSDLSGNPTYEELLQRVRETALDAYAHQDIPFEFLVQELLPERDMSRSPLFQVMFNYMLSYSAPSVDLPDLTLRLERLHSGAAQFDINVDMWETGDGLYGVVEYVTDIFHDTTITRFVGHLETILEGAVADPERTLDALPILTRQETHQLLVEGTDTARAYDLQPTWAELVAARVEETPDAVAAVCGESSVSYRELWTWAGAVASVLRERGVGTDDVVGLLAVRGLGLVTAIAGVLRAGAAYLPMDPDHPPERHRQVLEQSRSGHVLVSGALQPTLDEALAELDPDVRPWVGVLEDLPRRAAAEPPVPPRAPDALSYVIYTSGSTGVPKGVMIHQRGMLNHVRANVDFLAMDGGDVLAQTANQCFDISVWQFLAPLVLGSRVHVFEDVVTENPPRLLEAVEREQVTVFETVPSLLALMLEETEGELPLAALRWVLPTGEALPPELSRRWLRTYPEIPLINAYGPSECSDDVTLHALRDVPRADGRPAAIGRAVGNLTVTLVDRWQRPVPLGHVGEIAVGGVGVGRGYLHEPSRTARGARSLLRRARRARSPAVPQRRPGQAAAGRDPGVPRPHRPSGQGAGFPHRAGGDRGGPGTAAGGPGDGGRRPRGPAQRPPPGGLRHPCGGHGAGSRRVEEHTEGAAAGLHGADVPAGPGRAPPDPQRQGGPKGPAGTRRPARRGDLRGAAGRHRRASGCDLPRDPVVGEGGHSR